MVFPVGSRSVLFFGRRGLGPFCYGPGTIDLSLVGQPADGGADKYCYDPTSDSKGTHSYPYAATVWAYDAQDLAASRAGLKLPWDVTPYAVWDLDLPYSNEGHFVAGATYDAATGRIFVSQAFGENSLPVIHVFHVF